MIVPEARAEISRVSIHLYKQGISKAAIGRQLGIRRSTTNEWLTEYEQSGKISRQEKKRGRPMGQGRTLTPAQEERIQKDIIDQTPDQLKLSFALWSAATVKQLIKQYFLISMPIRTVRYYLSRWGFTPQYPVKRAYEQQPAQVKAWLDKTIQLRAKAENAEIHWGDETGLSSIEHYPRGYAPKGANTGIGIVSVEARESKYDLQRDQSRTGSLYDLRREIHDQGIHAIYKTVDKGI